MASHTNPLFPDAQEARLRELIRQEIAVTRRWSRRRLPLSGDLCGGLAAEHIIQHVQMIAGEAALPRDPKDHPYA